MSERVHTHTCKACGMVWCCGSLLHQLRVCQDKSHAEDASAWGVFRSAGKRIIAVALDSDTARDRSNELRRRGEQVDYGRVTLLRPAHHCDRDGDCPFATEPAAVGDVGDAIAAAGTPAARLLQIGLIAEAEFGHDPFSSSPPELALVNGIAGLRADRDAWESIVRDQHTQKAPCGHLELYAYTEDGGRTIFCLICTNATLGVRIAEMTADLEHMRHDAGSDSCADYAVRSRELAAKVEALEHDRDRGPVTETPATDRLASQHAYLSTACFHEKQDSDPSLHARCRQRCKFCDQVCGCDRGHATELPEATHA